MRKELEEFEVEGVTGGTVVMSEAMGVVGFNAIGKIYRVKGNFTEMRNLLLQLYDNNEMGNAEFDRLVESEFLARGWI